MGEKLPISNVEKTPEEIAAENRREALGVPEEFEGKEFYSSKVSHDQLHELLERMRADPEVAFNTDSASLNYRVSIPSRDKKGNIEATGERARTYHDLLRLRANIPEELRVESDGLLLDDELDGACRKIEVFADNQDLWARLNNPDDKLSKYKDEFFGLTYGAENEQLPDEYAHAVARGEVLPATKEKENKFREILGKSSEFKKAVGLHGADDKERKGGERKEGEKNPRSDFENQYEALRDELKNLSPKGLLQNLPENVFRTFSALTREQRKNFDSGNTAAQAETTAKINTFMLEQRAAVEEREKQEPAGVYSEGNSESTRKEWREKLRGLIMRAEKGVGKMSERAEHLGTYLADRSEKAGAQVKKFGLDVIGDFKVAGKGIAHTVMNPKETLHSAKTGAERMKAYAGYFADRNVSLNEKSEKLKTDLKSLTEGYNKLPFRKKAYITAALIGGGSLATVAGLPALHAILAGAMYGQRALGGAGFSLNRRKGMEARIAKARAKGEEHWLSDKSDAFKNTYAAALGTAYMGATAVVGHYAMEKLSDWLGHAFSHTTNVAPAHHIALPRETISSQIQTPEIHAPEMPAVSVNASPGHGYEYMAKQLWKQLQNKHLDPNKFAADSDMHKLLTADAHSIDKVVHQIASDPQHEFFRVDGTSVRIDPSAHMTVDTDGQILLDNVIHAP